MDGGESRLHRRFVATAQVLESPRGVRQRFENATARVLLCLQKKNTIEIIGPEGDSTLPKRLFLRAAATP
jgi:hypothetical protein